MKGALELLLNRFMFDCLQIPSGPFGGPIVLSWILDTTCLTSLLLLASTVWRAVADAAAVENF